MATRCKFMAVVDGVAKFWEDCYFADRFEAALHIAELYTPGAKVEIFLFQPY